MYEEIVYQMALPFQNASNAKVKALINHLGSAQAIFEEMTSTLKSRYNHLNMGNVLFSLTSEMLRKIDEERNRMEKKNISYVFFTDSNFPKRLKNCYDTPYYFFYKGNGQFQFPKSIAVVGTRGASSYGKDSVKRILSDLSHTDVVVVSGLAKGIDTMAHQTALDCGLRTIAVMGTGFQEIYPKINLRLSKEIVENNGTLISEFPYESKPDRFNFPIRNKTIAGLADAIIVVETPARGGSMITAMLAHSYNRDVFAVPGSIFQKSYEGCHFLIRKNIAAMICSGNDLLEMMNWDDVPQKKEVQRELFYQLDENEQKIVTFIDEKKEVYIDEIIEYMSNYSVSQITAFLLNLEFKGVIECKPGKIYQVL